jgi:hypothetical protein
MQLMVIINVIFINDSINLNLHWVAVKIGLNGLDPDLDQNKHRINLEWVVTKIGINFKPHLFRLDLDRI